jgi:hypothetical protein
MTGFGRTPVFPETIPVGPLSIDSGPLASKIFYVDTFATITRAISGLSRHTPSPRMTKIGRVENLLLDEIQHRAVDLGSLRLR